MVKELFVELHDGDPKEPRKVLIAVSDIRVIAPIGESDKSAMSYLRFHESYKTRLTFKGDSWTTYVHEKPETVAGLFGILITR